MLTWVLLLLCCSLIGADVLVRTVTVNNVNYDDFSLLCAEGIPLLMEDHKPRPCQPRPWKAQQRCPAGFWCHEGDDDSSFYCCPRSRKVANHCHLPPATGFGKQLMRRFYYDWKTDGCHELHYTGIGGNENSYMTYESCEAACRGAGEPTPKVFGGLSSSVTTKEGKKNPEKNKGGKNNNKRPTISFTISSTEVPPGPLNRKSTIKSSTIAPTQPPPATRKISPVPATQKVVTTTTSLPPITKTEPPPVEFVDNPCTLTGDRGTSGGIARKMWFFEQSSLSCVQFTFQGTGGNGNRFDSAQECMSTCGIGKPTRKSCDLPPAIGAGQYKIPRYYFDSKTHRCELFYYSGESGNDNRFYKKHKCERLCLGKQSKKKEQTRQPEAMTMPPTRFVDNFVSSEPNKADPEPEPEPPVTFPPLMRQTSPPTNRPTEIEIPSEQALTKQPTRHLPEHTHFERYETKPSPHVVEQLPETTEASWIPETTTLFYTPAPNTPSDSSFIVRTATPTPLEPQTFPTLVYVPKDEVPGTLPPYIYPDAASSPQKPIDDLFNHLMTAQLPTYTQAPPPAPAQPQPQPAVQQPVVPPYQPHPKPMYPAGMPYLPGQLPVQPPPNVIYPVPPQPSQPAQPQQQVELSVPHGVPLSGPQGNIFPTGAPTIIEKSQIGPAPEIHVPLGNFPWETTPPGYPRPNVPQVLVPTPEQIETMVGAMGLNPAPSVNMNLGQQIVTGIKPAEPPAGFLLSIPQSQRQWGTSPPPMQPAEAQVLIQPQQPAPPQIGLSSLGNVAVPISSGSPGQLPSQPEPKIEISIVPTEAPATIPTAQFIPTVAQVPGTLPPVYQGALGSFQPHPDQLTIDQPIPKVVINQVPTETFSLNLTENPSPPLNINIVTEQPTIEHFVLPNINVSIVSELNSPCQLHVTDPDVVIMCESDDVSCPLGSFCQIGLGQSICCPSMGGNPCFQPVQRGVGVAQITRWYFNPATKHCETFAFGGFQGNENNFVFFSDCQSTCGAVNPCEQGQPVPASNPEQKCSISNRCPADSMCHSVGDHADCCTAQQPITPPEKPKIDNDPCKQPIAEGSGSAAHHRWAFDQNAGRCISFIFQGEDGNLNNFLTKNDCQSICGSPPTVPSRCLQPGLSGDGEEYIARYFYSPEYRQCLHFIYSGKGGNENNFETQQDCLETCIANGVKFSSLASTIPQATFTFSFHPAPICPQGTPIMDASGEPLSCNVEKCPNGYVCTTMGPRQFCCPAPENFCLEPPPSVSVCASGGTPAAQIRFTYDPISDKCVRFSYEDCNPAVVSLNNFMTQPQCARLCCNQGYNLMYRRKVRMMLNDAPMEETRRIKRI